MSEFLTAALYKFVELPDYSELRDRLFDFCQPRQIKGTLLLAREGINGTVAGPETSVRQLLALLRSDPRLAELEHKESWSQREPFYRLKVKLKKEIVTLGVDGIDPSRMAGRYVKPEQWNELIAQPDVVLIDTRNDYEYQVGTFAGAVNPQTQSFSQLPQWVEAQMQPGGLLAEKDGCKPKVAMFCTGGIRCEKSTAFMRTRGFDEVYHLEGGILKYLEKVPASASAWQGECFVFDERVAVGHDLKPGHFELCRSCRHPLSDLDKASPLYEAGVSCPRCHASLSAEQRRSFAERQRQITLARARNERHIGVPRGRPASPPEAAGPRAEPSEPAAA
ncbi:MAG: rhodanese-related sulfurtransferase [Betaproteobacteria bacterium]